ncbi:protein kinase [Microvenator marinus]|uniref:Protein kinase n=1 Tax=Microvenator marinus TaxID=2600177 RepID=A0A5B8XSC4_9DELT|nr:WD40 repeat domain-containing serine/threonine protein kinase [Microvenator marinus]QED28415.1 protein kinase [Microvenator marinus]
MGDRQAYDRRRKEFANRLPSHYCVRCSAVVYPEDTSCLDCGAAEPEGSWPTIQDGFDPWIGRVLDGRYLVTKRVGQGAMGSVYRVESLAISREFAIKIINFKQTSSGADPEQIRSRLQREIEAISRLRNPHVVPFYELLELFDNFVGIVMDFVSGQTLDELVRRDGPLELRRAVTVLRQIANGLHEAHEIGMIHRDVKPENMMLEVMPAGDDFVHVLDFGIVRLDDGVSMTKGFLGTPLYASPEQAMAGEIDRRSDIYSLGAVMFFLLSGRPPFVSDNVYEILRSHVRTPAPRLSDVVKDKTIPALLESLVADMLAKNPTQRPQTLQDVIKKVDELLYSGALHEVPKKATESTEILPDRRKTQLGTGPIKAVSVQKSPASESSESDFHKEDSGDSSSFVSTERDHTGPKAAIFKRYPSRSSVRAMVDESRELNRTLIFDRIRQSNTGVFPLGVKIERPIDLCAANETGVALTDELGHIYYSDGEHVTEVYKAKQIVHRICPIKNGVLIGLQDGSVVRAETKKPPVTLFQEVRQNPVRGIAYCDHTGMALAGADSGKVYVQRSAQSDWVRLQDGPPVLGLAINRIGSIFAVARKTQEIEVFNVSSPKTPFVRFSVPCVVEHLSFSNDGHLLAVLLENDTIAIHMVLTGKRLMIIKEDVHHLRTVFFNSDNALTGYFGMDGALFGVDLQREMAGAKT